MKQYRIFADLEKEEQYLNEMASKGYIFKKCVGFVVYHFEKTEPIELNYMIDYRIFSKKCDFESYVSLFEDAGYKHVFGTRNTGGQYFLPKGEEQGEIFSDRESKAKRHIRLSRSFFASVVVTISYTLGVMVTYKFKISNTLFLTPGLWEREGAEFWRAFLFELPFVILRVMPILLMVALCGFFAFWSIRAKKAYNKVINEEN